MLSKSAARAFFLIGTVGFSVIFLLLTLDTIRRVPEQTNADNLTPQAIAGKHLWDKNNCMGCHTILGEGAYYAPELTKVYERRGPAFIKAMLRDPQAMYPGPAAHGAVRLLGRGNGGHGRLPQVDRRDGPQRLSAGAHLLPVAVPTPMVGADVVAAVERPKVFNQLCIACHSLGGQGGVVGSALDDVGSRLSYADLVPWLTDPQKIKPGTAMPKLPLSRADIGELASFLSQMKQQPGSTGEGSN